MCTTPVRYTSMHILYVFWHISDKVPVTTSNIKVYYRTTHSLLTIGQFILTTLSKVYYFTTHSLLTIGQFICTPFFRVSHVTIACTLCTTCVLLYCTQCNRITLARSLFLGLQLCTIAQVYPVLNHRVFDHCYCLHHDTCLLMYTYILIITLLTM